MKESVKEKGGCHYTCQIILSVLIFIMTFVALFFSIAVALSCDFVEVQLSENTTLNATSLSFGQYRYNRNGEGCQSLKENNIDVSWDFITGQIGLLVAVACAIVVIILLLVEAICCRFACNRCIITTLFVLAVIGMAMTFLTYASSVCRSEFEGGAYPCQASSATWYSVVAVAFYVFTMFFYCLSPKPTPLCRKMRKNKKNERDPCFCCEKIEEKEREEEKDEEKAEPKAQEPPDEAVVAVAAGTQAATMSKVAREERPPSQVVKAEREPKAQEPPDEAVVAVAAGTQAAAMANMAREERPPSQVVYDNDDMSDDKSSIGVMTVPFYMSADVLEGDLFFDVNTVA